MSNANRLQNWKTLALIAALNLLVWANPIITYACSTNGAGHGGC